MLRVVTSVKSLIVACHQPQEIGLIAGGCNGGMIAVGEFYELVILYAVCFVNLAVSGVEALHCKALLGVEKEVVDFLCDTLCGHIVHVVLMRREACPVALCEVALADGENL